MLPLGEPLSTLWGYSFGFALVPSSYGSAFRILSILCIGDRVVVVVVVPVVVAVAAVTVPS